MVTIHCSIRLSRFMFSPRVQSLPGRWTAQGKRLNATCQNKFYLRRYASRKEAQENRHPPAWRALSTLDPQHLTMGDFIDVSHYTHPAISFLPKTHNTLLYYFKSKALLPFPPGSRGFLYYRSFPDLPVECSGVRFRITSRGTPSSFEEGSDLLRPDGLPWQVPFSAMALATGPSELWTKQLLKEQLVAEEQLAHCRAMFHQKKRIEANTNIYHLGQVFSLNLGGTVWFWIVGRTKIGLWHYPSMFADNRVHMKSNKYPYSGESILLFVCVMFLSCPAGSCLAALELSTHPDHAGTKTIVLRILKFVKPIKCVLDSYDGYIPMPEEGSIYHRTFTQGRGSPQIKPWTCNVYGKHSPGTEALRILVENRTSIQDS